MERYSNKTCLVYDNGLFVELAVRLARDFGTVYYYTPWKSAFPRRAEACMGEGIPGVEKVYNLWDVEDKVDLWVFPDVYDGDLQRFLRKDGRRVWGSAGSEFLELDRMRTRRLQKTLGIQSPVTRCYVGVNDLREGLEGTENRWVKVSMFRGDMETWNHFKIFTSAPFIDDLAKTYGPLADDMEFIVEDHVEGVEIGYDGFTVDGQWPDKSLFGVEVKDLGYIGRIKPYPQLPRQIRQVNESFSPTLKKEQCRSFLAFEMRIGTSRKPVVIDPCMRCSSPCTEVWMELYHNLSDILWKGADGVMVNPDPVATWAVMGMIHSSWAVKNWTPIHIPNDVRQWVKLRNLVVKGGHEYFAPQRSELPEIGAVVGVGETLEEAIEMMDNIAEQVAGCRIEIRQDSMAKAMEVIEQCHKYGIEIGD